VVQHLAGLHHSAHAHLVVGRLADVLSTVVDRVKLSELVAVADSLEQRLNLFTRTHLLKVVLTDSQVGVRLGEQQVDSLRLITVIAKVSYRSLVFEWDVGSNSGDTEAAI
jgi:hypothetical protein